MCFYPRQHAPAPPSAELVVFVHHALQQLHKQLLVLVGAHILTMGGLVLVAVLDCFAVTAAAMLQDLWGSRRRNVERASADTLTCIHDLGWGALHHSHLPLCCCGWLVLV